MKKMCLSGLHSIGLEWRFSTLGRFVKTQVSGPPARNIKVLEGANR